jgi:hypothetical protein
MVDIQRCYYNGHKGWVSAKTGRVRFGGKIFPKHSCRCQVPGSVMILIIMPLAIAPSMVVNKQHVPKLSLQLIEINLHNN